MITPHREEIIKTCKPLIEIITWFLERCLMFMKATDKNFKPLFIEASLINGIDDWTKKEKLDLSDEEKEEKLKSADYEFETPEAPLSEEVDIAVPIEVTIDIGNLSLVKKLFSLDDKVIDFKTWKLLDTKQKTDMINQLIKNKVYKIIGGLKPTIYDVDDKGMWNIFQQNINSKLESEEEEEHVGHYIDDYRHPIRRHLKQHVEEVKDVYGVDKKDYVHIFISSNGQEMAIDFGNYGYIERLFGINRDKWRVLNDEARINEIIKTGLFIRHVASYSGYTYGKYFRKYPMYE